MAQAASEAVGVSRSRASGDEVSIGFTLDARLTTLLGFLAVALLLSLLYLSQASVVANAGYEVSSLEVTRDRWKLKNDQLNLQLAESRSLANVEREAKRLGMGKPEKTIFVQVALAEIPIVQAGAPTPEAEPAWTDRAIAWWRDLW